MAVERQENVVRNVAHLGPSTYHGFRPKLKTLCQVYILYDRICQDMPGTESFLPSWFSWEKEKWSSWRFLLPWSWPKRNIETSSCLYQLSMILCGVPSHPANPCSTRYARRLGGRHCCDVMLAHRGRIDRQIRKFTPILGDNLSPSSPFVIYLCHHFCHPKEPLILRHYKGTSDDWNKDWYLSEVTLPPRWFFGKPGKLEVFWWRNSQVQLSQNGCLGSKTSLHLRSFQLKIGRSEAINSNSYKKHTERNGFLAEAFCDVIRSQTFSGMLPENCTTFLDKGKRSTSSFGHLLGTQVLKFSWRADLEPRLESSCCRTSLPT